jgi:hypothetical protein
MSAPGPKVHGCLSVAVFVFLVSPRWWTFAWDLGSEGKMRVLQLIAGPLSLVFTYNEMPYA